MFHPPLASHDILESITDGFFILDSQWRITYANRRAIEILGRDDLTSGESLWSFYPEAADSEFGRAYREALESGTPQHVEALYAPHERWYEAHAYPSAAGLTIYFRDITSRKHAEQELQKRDHRFELVASATQEMIYDYDIERGVVWRSNAIESVFGYRRDDVPRDPEWWLERIHPRDRSRVRKSIRSAMAGSDRYWSHEYRVLAGDGRSLSVLDRATIVRDAHGKAVRVIGARMDISEQKLVEDELRSSREQARRLARRVIRIQEEERACVARDVHDVLGQALTAIKIEATALALDESLQKTRREQAGRIGTLVDQTIESIREMAIRLRPMVLDDLGLHSALVAEARAFTNQTGITCTVRNRARNRELDPDVSTTIFRIAQESLTNVARHAEASSVQIKLWSSRGALHVEIRDDGRGIDHSPEAAGTLGLIGMRERATLVGGDLAIQQCNRRGTRVLLSIPHARPPLPETE